MKDFEDPLYSSYVANCVFTAFSSYTAIMLNTLTIHAIRKTSSMPKPLKTLLLSLAVSDLGVGLLVQPFYFALLVMQLQQNKPSSSTYITYYFIRGTFSIASIFGVLALSVDRFLAIHLHLRYQELVTHRRVVTVVITLWMFSTFLASNIPLLVPVDTVHIARLFAIIFGLCFIFTALVYFKIYITVRRHSNEIQILQVQVGQNCELSNATRQKKSAVSTFYIYLVFLACCLPEYCGVILNTFQGLDTTFMQKLDSYTWTLVFLNSSFNPIIYCWKMRHIRHSMIDIVRRLLPKQSDR